MNRSGDLWSLFTVISNFHVPLIIALALPFLGLTVDLSNASPLTFDRNSSYFIWSVLLLSFNSFSETRSPIRFLENALLQKWSDTAWYLITSCLLLNFNFLSLGILSRLSTLFIHPLAISDTVETSEQKESLSDSSSQWKLSLWPSQMELLSVHHHVEYCSVTRKTLTMLLSRTLLQLQGLSCRECTYNLYLLYTFPARMHGLLTLGESLEWLYSLPLESWDDHSQ